jgi:hypothetical protein
VRWLVFFPQKSEFYWVQWRPEGVDFFVEDAMDDFYLVEDTMDDFIYNLVIDQ